MITYFRIFPYSMRWIVFSLDMSIYTYLIVLNTVFFYTLCYHCNGLNCFVFVWEVWGFVVEFFWVFFGGGGSCTVSDFTQSIENLRKHDIFRIFFLVLKTPDILFNIRIKFPSFERKGTIFLFLNM